MDTTLLAPPKLRLRKSCESNHIKKCLFQLDSVSETCIIRVSG